MQMNEASCSPARDGSCVPVPGVPSKFATTKPGCVDPPFGALLLSFKGRARPLLGLLENLKVRGGKGEGRAGFRV